MNVWQKFKGWIAEKMNFTVETSPAMKEESFLEWLGVKRKNKDVMAEVTYFTCLKMMSETLAKIPWKYYQKTEKGIIEPELSDVAKLLKNRPNPFMTPTAFWNAVEMNRNHFGNAYVYVRSKFKRKKYGGEYKVMDLWIMPSNCVQIVVDDEGYFGGRGKIWYVYNDKYSGQQYVFGTDEVLHFKTSHSLDGITGLPVQAILKTTVEGAAASQDYLNSLYESGLTGKATLEYTGDLNKDLKIVSCHLGQGASICAINGGKAVDNSLGFTSLAGLPMGTRCGDIDPSIVTFLMKKENLTTEQMDKILNKQSGKLGISGVSFDDRDIEVAAEEGNARAKLAIDVFVYQVVGYIGRFAAQMNGVDVITFAGGIGENAIDVRKQICESLSF